MTRDELLTDAKKRQAETEAERNKLVRMAQELNAQGVKLEQALFIIEGEIKALTAFGEP